MPTTCAELFLERDDVVSRQAQLEALLCQQPGVHSFQVVAHDDPTVEVCLRVAIDPEVTNPVILKEALAREGFTVLSAAARP
jgi:hypothetical protein